MLNNHYKNSNCYLTKIKLNPLQNMPKSTKLNNHSRAKYDCPAELKELIRLTNLVPIGILTPDFESEVRFEIQRLKNETGDPAPEFSAYEFVTKQIKHLPKIFLDYLDEVAYVRAFPFESEPKSYRNEMRYKHEFVRYYVEYCDIRGSMLSFVLRLENERRMMRAAEKEHGLEENSLTFEHFTSLNWEAYPIFISTTLLRDDNGKLQTTGLAALIGKFDDSRLRRCEICERVFWAKRKESKTCSLQCANVLRVRRYRSSTTEEKANKKLKRTANGELIKNGKAKSIKRRK
jgi:hypothetical protein